MRAVIFDLDGTLCDCEHRRHHVTNGKHDWPAFFAEMADDPVVEQIAELAWQLSNLNKIVLCSSRPEDYRGVTETWLAEHRVPYSNLYMRPADDTRPDHAVKLQLLQGIREDGLEPWLVIDDRPSVVAMWREQGLTCLQCRDWNEAPPVEPGMLTIMVGPSGAGKTTWLDQAIRAGGITASQIISSDEIRDELCGDFRDQSKNAQVFAALHAQVKARIWSGLNAVVDATNIRNKDRLAIVDLAPPTAKVQYIVIDRPLHEKRITAGWRGQVRDKDGQPFDLIGKHAETFRSNLKDILRGDGRPNVEVVDVRTPVEVRRAAA